MVGEGKNRSTVCGGVCSRKEGGRDRQGGKWQGQGQKGRVCVGHRGVGKSCVWVRRHGGV